MKNETFETVAQNKKAFHNYFVEEKFEAGIELFGTATALSKMGKCLCWGCTFRLMKRGTFLIKTRCELSGC